MILPLLKPHEPHHPSTKHDQRVYGDECVQICVHREDGFIQEIVGLLSGKSLMIAVRTSHALGDDISSRSPSRLSAPGHGTVSQLHPPLQLNGVTLTIRKLTLATSIE